MLPSLADPLTSSIDAEAVADIALRYLMITIPEPPAPPVWAPPYAPDPPLPVLGRAAPPFCCESVPFKVPPPPSLLVVEGLLYPLPPPA